MLLSDLVNEEAKSPRLELATPTPGYAAMIRETPEPYFGEKKTPPQPASTGKSAPISLPYELRKRKAK